MDLTLLSGVVRNRKMTSAPSRGQSLFNDGGSSSSYAPSSTVEKIFQILGRNNLCRRFSLRVHKFSFQWDLALHLFVCIFSLAPFFFSGDRLFSLLPISVWIFYHVLFLLGPRQANLVVPGFGKLKHSFKSTIEDFFSPKLLPVLSISFLLVALTLAVTGHRLGGPPLCYHSCSVCLAQWSSSIKMIDERAASVDQDRVGCGYANGKEMLGFYTMAQTSFLLFLTVVVAMAVCLAWRVAEEEREERTAAEDWLKRESPQAFDLRATLIKRCGSPASSIRPEGSFVWVMFGVIAAMSFTLLGWHNWYVLPPSHTATLLIVLNLLTILMTILILHLGFFGRILALYKRNFIRVECLTQLLKEHTSHESNLTATSHAGMDLDAWWNCRNFVLNDDLSLDYDIGGLAVSATFLINVFVFIILLTQVYQEGGHIAMLEPPGSYCAYASMYITACLIKIFTLATNTYEEQHRHINELQNLSSLAAYRMGTTGTDSSFNIGLQLDGSHSPRPLAAMIQRVKSGASGTGEDEENNHNNSPFFIDDDSLSPITNKISNHGNNEVLSILVDPLHGHSNHDINHRDNSSNNVDNNNFAAVDADEEENDAASPHESSTLLQSGVPLRVVSPKPVLTSSTSGIFESMLKRSFFLSPQQTQQQQQQQQTQPSPMLPLNNQHNNSQHRVNNSSSQQQLLLQVPGLSRQPSDGRGAIMMSNNNINNASSSSLVRSSRQQSRSNLSPPESNTNNTNSTLNSIDNSSSGKDKDRDLESMLMISPPKPVNVSNAVTGLNGISIPRPALSRGVSSSVENYRQTIAEIISQIRKYDPYPCILGIPIMPALFSTSKFYIFISFLLIGTRMMVSCFRAL